MIHFNVKLRPRQQYSSNAPSTHLFHKHGISPCNNSTQNVIQNPSPKLNITTKRRECVKKTGNER